ncbi:YceI family protein [bacterium]|nr:YceI family protein [bacterium]
MKELSIIKRSIGLVLFLLAALPVLAFGQVVLTKSGTVSFTSHVPLHDFTGTSDTMVGQIDFAEGTVDFYVDLATLKTGIGKRDKDMRLTLDVKNYPFAEFFGKLTSPVNMEATAPQTVSVQGTFSIHGVSNEVTVPGTLKREGTAWVLSAKWSLLLGDYNIEPPKLLIMKVDEKQEIEILARLEPQTN